MAKLFIQKSYFQNSNSHLMRFTVKNEKKLHFLFSFKFIVSLVSSHQGFSTKILHLILFVSSRHQWPQILKI